MHVVSSAAKGRRGILVSLNLVSVSLEPDFGESSSALPASFSKSSRSAGQFAVRHFG